MVCVFVCDCGLCVAHSVIGVLFMCYGNVIEVFLLMCVLPRDLCGVCFRVRLWFLRVACLHAL